MSLNRKLLVNVSLVNTVKTQRPIKHFYEVKRQIYRFAVAWEMHASLSLRLIEIVQNRGTDFWQFVLYSTIYSMVAQYIANLLLLQYWQMQYLFLDLFLRLPYSTFIDYI